MSFAPSHIAKAEVIPIDRLERRKKGPKGLSRATPLKPSTKGPKPSPLGHCTEEQKARVAGQVCIVCGSFFDACDPAHVIPRGHPKMSAVAANDVRAVVPLCRRDHDLFDEGKIDLLPLLEPAWRDSQEWAAGAVGLASATRSITGGAA